MNKFMIVILVGIITTSAFADRICAKESYRWGRLVNNNLNSTNLNLLTEIRVIGLQLMVKCSKSESKVVYDEAKKLNKRIEILTQNGNKRS